MTRPTDRPLSPEEIAAAEARCQQAKTCRTCGGRTIVTKCNHCNPFGFVPAPETIFSVVTKDDDTLCRYCEGTKRRITDVGQFDFPRALVGNAQLHQLRAKMRATEAALTAVATLMDEMKTYQADNDFPTVSEYEGFFLRLRALLDEKE
jgi:hypothetical protein